MQRLLRDILIAASSLGLAACSSDNKLAQCPSASALIDTATLPIFEGSPPKLLYTAYILKAKRDCDIDKISKLVDASVDIDFRAARSDATAEATYTVPYFVAIATDGRILTKRQFAVQVQFAPGQTVTDFSQNVGALSLTVAKDKKASEYGIIVGFQVTKAQLDFNRRAGRYAQ